MPMPVESKAERRRIADEFKERKVPRGIFAITCTTTGEKWTGSSPNLGAAQNSLWFQLRGGLYRNAVLQQVWKQHGEAAFTFEILEQLDDDVSPLLLSELIAAKKREWAVTLQSHLL